MPRRKPGASPVLSAAGTLSNAIRLHGEHSPEADAARVEVVTVQLEDVIRRLVAEAPPLPEENKRRIAAALNSPAGAR